MVLTRGLRTLAAMPDPRLHRRVELLIRLASPWLDLALAMGDRVSRVLTREDPAYVPVRMAHPGQAAPRRLRLRP
jgi:hypothetical protein